MAKVQFLFYAIIVEVNLINLPTALACYSKFLPKFQRLLTLLGPNSSLFRSRFRLVHSSLRYRENLLACNFIHWHRTSYNLVCPYKHSAFLAQFILQPILCTSQFVFLSSHLCSIFGYNIKNSADAFLSW